MYASQPKRDFAFALRKPGLHGFIRMGTRQYRSCPPEPSGFEYMHYLKQGKLWDLGVGVVRGPNHLSQVRDTPEMKRLVDELRRNSSLACGPSGQLGQSIAEL